jgi:hypothetical protein
MKIDAPGINIKQSILFFYMKFWAGLQCIKYRAVSEDAAKAGRKIPSQYISDEQCDFINLGISAIRMGAPRI